ncbi:MAG: tetratricopeptide repeat protein, partial [Candidatus Thorarchaeota archaeon]
MKQKQSKIKFLKSLILIAILDIFSLELFRATLEIQFNLIYFLTIFLLVILQLSFLAFIKYISKKIDEPKKEFQISEYLTLKLERKATNIYVNGKLVSQCKFLLLNIPSDNITEFNNIQSIDEAAEKLSHDLEFQDKSKINIPPETEFWGHCSNLQAWVECNYNPCLLHSNLAFTLLKKLTEAGDPMAKKVFKQEVMLRFESFNPSTQLDLLENGYLKYFNKQEKEEIFKLILDENIWIQLGLSYIKTNMLEKALHSFLQARSINPINLQTLILIVQIYIRLNENEKASKFVKEIFDYFPEDFKALIGENDTFNL